jgi:DNA repair protein RAD16
MKKRKAASAGSASRARAPKALTNGKATADTPPPRAKPKQSPKTPPPTEAAMPKGKAAGSKPMASILQRFKVSDFSSSTKIEALVDEVTQMRKSDKTAKALVFSQFGAMLELLEFRLKRAGFNCVVYRGGMSMQARSDALAAFNKDPSLTVILISLKAGGEGLNLQAASHVFLMDPWWNPACELQAIQRAHRIGQTREVKAVRFITEGTIEEKILALQEKKQLVFDGTIGGSADSIAKLTEQDLHFLFQH